MFSNSYQSGTYIELYSLQNKDTKKFWKFSGKISNEYDQSVKTYVSHLPIGGTSRMNIPKNDKDSLGIVQSYIVFQLYIFSLKSFGIEISISDTNKTRRRIMFSTSSKETVYNPLHCRVPLIDIPVNKWINLSIDVLSYVSECFKSLTFRSIDYISISANCKIKRIFTMRNSLPDNSPNFLINQGVDSDQQIYPTNLYPKIMYFPQDVENENINCNYEKLANQLNSKIQEGNLIILMNNNNINSLNRLSNAQNLLKNGFVSIQNDFDSNNNPQVIGKLKESIVKSLEGFNIQMNNNESGKEAKSNKNKLNPIKTKIANPIGRLVNENDNLMKMISKGIENENESKIKTNNKITLPPISSNKYDFKIRKSDGEEKIMENKNKRNQSSSKQKKGKERKITPVKKNFVKSAGNVFVKNTNSNLNKENIFNPIQKENFGTSAMNYNSYEKWENKENEEFEDNEKKVKMIGEREIISPIKKKEETYEKNQSNSKNIEKKPNLIDENISSFHEQEQDSFEKYEKIDKYYEIPIKKNLIEKTGIGNENSAKKNDGFTHFKSGNKKEIINEIIKEKSIEQTIDERPYTPPFN